MDVPLNGALGRLLCKFVAIFAILYLVVWSLLQYQKSASDVAELEGKLSFAQEQLSSLHAQIDVITRHKEKIESLLNEERQTCEQNKNEYSERILHLEKENERCEREFANVNGMAGNATNVEEINVKNGSNAAEKEKQNKIVGQNDSRMEEQQQQPIEEPEGEGVKKEDELGEQKEDEDQFEKERGNEGEMHGIVGQIKPPNEFANIEEKKPTRKESQPNGGERIGDDYIFQRPVPREDLVFHREAEKEEFDAGKKKVKKEKWMNGSELLRKLDEKKKKGKKEEEAEIQDRDFRE